MTLFIAICDDERNISAELEGMLISILDRLNIKYEIDIYFSGEELCRAMETGGFYNLIFLDIEFAQSAINGIETGRFIRETRNNNIVSIIYMSWEMKYSMQLFSIRPFDFMIKPLGYSSVENVVKKYVEIAELWTRDFTYKVTHDTYKVPIKELVYLQSDKRKIILHLTSGETREFYGSMKDIYEEQLKRFDFIFIHASYMVNYDYIAAARYDQIFLTCKKTPLPISQPKRKEVRKIFYDISQKRRV